MLLLPGCPGEAGRAPGPDASMRRDGKLSYDLVPRADWPPSPDSQPSKDLGVAPDKGLPQDKGTPKPDQGGGGCTATETAYKGRCYSTPGYKWMDYNAAKASCTQVGAQVASITSAGEDQFIYGILPPATQGAYIGLRRAGGSFVWESGESYGAYTNWAPNEPNNSNNNEACVVLWGPNLSNASLRGKWNDAPCDSNRDTVICERVP
jgi:hypothetical protein